MKITFNSNNPYYGTPQTNWYTGPWKNKIIVPDSRDKKIIIEPKYHLRPQNMSDFYYGSPVYYWVLWLRNQDVIKDPIWDFVAGKTIILPSPEYIREIYQ